MRMSEDVAQAWLDLNDRAWAISNMKVLHACGLSPEDGKVLYDCLLPEARLHISRLVDAGRMADLDVTYLHWWAAAGLLRPSETPAAATRRSRRAPTISFTTWATTARRYIAATGGNQQRASMAAAAGLSPEEAATSEVTEDVLRTMIALRGPISLPQ